MEYRSKINSAHNKQVIYPFKPTTLENQFQKSSSKNKSNHMLFKQQIMRDRASKYDNKNDFSTQTIYSKSQFISDQDKDVQNQVGEYSRLLNKFNKNKIKYERNADNENSKSFLNKTMKIGQNRNDNNQTLNISFKSNQSKFKFPKNDKAKSPQPTLSKCLSMNFLETLEIKNRMTPPNRQSPQDGLKLRPRVESKKDEQIKLMNELKMKTRTIKQLEQRVEELVKQLASKNKLEVEYYKLLNKNILFEEEARTKQRRIEQLEIQLQNLNEKNEVLEVEKFQNQQRYKKGDLRIQKQYEQSLAEWKKINQILSDSLIKLNHQNSSLSKKLSQLESKSNMNNNKLSQAQKLISSLKSNLESEKNNNTLLIEQHGAKMQQMANTINKLEKNNQSMQRLENELRQQNSEMIEQYQQKIHNALFLQSKNRLLNEEVEELKSIINKIKYQNVQNANQGSEQNKVKKPQTKSASEFTNQEQQLRQKLLILKISQQEKQRKYQDTIQQYKNKVQLLEDQIKQIKFITSQSYSILGGQITEQSEIDEYRRQNLKLQANIVELKSRLQVFGIIEKQLRERLERSNQNLEQMENQTKSTVAQKQAMIDILKERNQLLEKELEIVNNINTSLDNSTNESKLEEYIKDQNDKIHNMEDIITTLHSKSKKLEYQLIHKSQFIEQLRKQMDRDQQTIKDFRLILGEMNKRLVGHSQLLEITNKSAISQQLRFGNYREQIRQQMKILKFQNGSLEGELKGIYTKLEILEEKIGEEDDEERQDASDVEKEL